MRLWPKLKGLISTVLGKTNQNKEDWSYGIEDKEEKVYYKGKAVIHIYTRNMPTVCPLTHEIKGSIDKPEMYVLTPFIDTDNTIGSPGVEKFTNERYLDICEGIVKFELFKNNLTERQGY